MEPAFNPYLRPSSPPSVHVGGKGYIELPGKAENLRWQTRKAAPTEYENALADALEQAYTSGAVTAEEIVESLNRRAFRNAAGELWTAASLTSEMSVLGQ
ncbi:recombinase-like helix-turn-helix domain-containing protein [Pusillimonas sp.]|uniref:recombinase-like helix-turn-helix domain-containing protein n=1 Tax=Pusillimonas sp. TaxID=3040095 RepID=UPI0029AEC2A7|nr:recombinase-like helix-turn-helix domain-containing protein [Pusillimonas sp.]MDX3895416.1 hypothetical protein [Pusillimonas sp.]